MNLNRWMVLAGFRFTNREADLEVAWKQDIVMPREALLSAADYALLVIIPLNMATVLLVIPTADWFLGLDTVMGSWLEFGVAPLPIVCGICGLVEVLVLRAGQPEFVPRWTEKDFRVPRELDLPKNPHFLMRSSLVGIVGCLGGGLLLAVILHG